MMIASIVRTLVLVGWCATMASTNDVIVRPPTNHEDRRRCQEITIPMCLGIGYNLTSIPNQFFHETQEEAGLEVHQFWPLVKIQCSPDLQFFVCSLYVPLCVPEYQKPLPPCRSLCERAKSGCAPVMAQHNFPWPERMRCDKLPEYGNKDQLCMDINVTSDRRYRPEATTLAPSLLLPTKSQTRKPTHKLPLEQEDQESRRVEPFSRSALKSMLLQLINNESKSMLNRPAGNGALSCVMPCRDLYFSSPDEQQFINYWLLTWSVLCFACTLLTLLTFLVDTHRFRYPERPIIIMSFCYFLVSVGYLVRAFGGHEQIACNGALLRCGCAGPLQCTVVFVLIYFFGMAASIWWVILCFAWFLASGLKWSSEAITKCSQHFHQVAWILSAVKTIAVIAISAIDGDPVAGVCFVGHTNLSMLRGFVIAPLVIYLLLGLVFLIVGFVSMAHIRNIIKLEQQLAGNAVESLTAQSSLAATSGQRKRKQQEGTDKLEYLMIRLAIFSALYVVQMATLIGCYLYEQHNREQWQRDLFCEDCVPESQPNFAVFMIKYLATFAVGITLGGWTWTRKSIDAWKRCCSLRCCQRPESPEKLTNATTMLSINGAMIHSSSRASQLANITQTCSGLMRQDMSMSGIMRPQRAGSSATASANGMMPMCGSATSPLIAHTIPNISPATTGSIVA